VWVLIISACSTSTLIPNQSSVAVVVAREAVDIVDDTIPAIYLVECELMRDFDERDDSLLAIQETIRINAEKYHDCHIRHNGVVKILKTRSE